MVRAGTVLLALLSAVGCLVEGKSAGRTVKGSYIVEFHEDADQSEFYSSLASVATKRRNLDYSLFKGATIQFLSDELAERYAGGLGTRPGVKNVFPLQRYSIPKPDVKWTAEAGRDYVDMKRRDEGADVFSTHVMTGIDLLHREGLDGKGIKIAIIDSGIDYTHPALGGCFGKGCLVSYGRDLAGDEYDGIGDPVPDDDPMDCNGHGTHVAGTIAAQAGNPFGIIGAAPGVTLGAYKVFGCGDGGVRNDILIAAFNEAYEAGSHILSCSIGGVQGWSEDPWAVVVSRIVEKGVPSIVAAGNDGEMGMWYASGAADGKRVTAVASIDNVVTPSLLTSSSYEIDSAGGSAPFGWAPGEPALWSNVTMPLYAASFDRGAVADACEPLPDDTPNLAPFIVLIRRGTCAFAEKAAFAAAKGARFVMFYNNVPGALAVDVRAVPDILGAAMVEPGVGAALVDALGAGRRVVAKMADPLTAPQKLSVVANNLTGGAASTFTTWGPTYEGNLKPQLAGVGGNVLSTYPLVLGGYAVLSGTSMATPLVAGVVALVAQARSTLDPALIEGLLCSSARPVRWNDGLESHAAFAPVAQQGGGLVDAYAAAYLNTTLNVSSLAWNDTDHFRAAKSFVVRNLGPEEVTYDLGHVPALTAFTYADGRATNVTEFPPELVDSHANITFARKQLTVPAGGRATVSVTARPPAGLDAERLPVWSGFIVLNGTDGTALTLPYQGIGGSLHSQRALRDVVLTSSRPSDPLAPLFEPVSGRNASFLLPPRGVAPEVAVNFALPLVAFELTFGSPLVTVGVTAITRAGRRQQLLRTINIETFLGQPDGYDPAWKPRGLQLVDWDGRLDTGGYGAAGRYKFVVRALRVFGDRNGGDDEWDVLESTEFNIAYAG